MAVTAAADDLLKHVIIFLEKQVLPSYVNHLPGRQFKCQALFSPQKEKRMSSAKVLNGTLTLKMPRKPVSENVVCLCRLLDILTNFSNIFLHTGKQCGPDQTAPSSLIWIHTV